MKERQHGQGALLAALAFGEPDLDLAQVRPQIAVRERGGFGRAGGPSRILQDRNVPLGVDRHLAHAAVVRDEPVEPHMPLVFGHLSQLAALEDREEQVPRKGQELGHAPNDDTLEARLTHRQGDLVVKQLEIERHHDLGLGIVDLVHDLARHVEGIVIDDRAARLEHGEIADHVIGAIGEQQAYLDASAHAKRLEARRRPVDEMPELAVARAAVQEIECRKLSELGDCLFGRGARRVP